MRKYIILFLTLLITTVLTVGCSDNNSEPTPPDTPENPENPDEPENPKPDEPSLIVIDSEGRPVEGVEATYYEPNFVQRYVVIDQIEYSIVSKRNIDYFDGDDKPYLEVARCHKAFELPSQSVKIHYGIVLNGEVLLTRMIGYSAFQHCYSLTEIQLPESLKVIYKYAFYYCEKLEELILPESLEWISFDSWYKSGLKSIKLLGCPKFMNFSTYADHYASNITLYVRPEYFDYYDRQTTEVGGEKVFPNIVVY